MSHFAGLVILTPEYAEIHGVDDALDKYDENLEVPEYSCGEVSDSEKVDFILYYYTKENPHNNIQHTLFDKLVENGVTEKYDPEKHKYGEDNHFHVELNSHKEEYAELFKSEYSELFDRFEELYKEHGGSWNGNCWRVNPISGKWEEYSTYNPNSKWDWYDTDGRWRCCLKTKSGEYVNECLLDEIDWTDFTPEDYEKEEKEDWMGKKYRPLKKDVRFHFTKSSPPFCLVVDGEWIEKGEMLYFGMTKNEKNEEDWCTQFFDILDKLPKNSEVYNIDFHI